MQIGVRHTGIPLGSLIKMIFVGYGITSLLIAVIYSLVQLLFVSSKLAYLSVTDLAIYAVVGLLGIAFQAFFIALFTGFGLWIYERFRQIEVYFLD